MGSYRAAEAVDSKGRALDRCKYCGALIRWVTMIPSLKANPLEPEPRPDGNVILEKHNDTHARGLRLEDLPYTGERYVSHWSTCPKAPPRKPAPARSTTAALRRRGLTLSAPSEWPAEIKGLGPRAGGRPLARCVRCPPSAHPSIATTNVTYGDRPYCRACAAIEAKAASSPQDA